MTSPIQGKEPDVSLALLRAASGGDLETVKSLLAAGADVNCANESGQTALILAAVMGQAEIVVHLISAGADPRLRDRLDLTALEWSTRRGFSDVSQFLTRISPPLQKPRSKREAESKETDSDTQPSVSVTAEAEPAALVTTEETSPTTNEKEVPAELQTLAPQRELVETATTEASSEEAAVATHSSTPLPAVDQSPVVANELESQRASVEIVTESEAPLPAVDDSTAEVASELESQPASAELTTESVIPLPAVDYSAAEVASEPESRPASAEATTESLTPMLAVDDSPAEVASEPESQPASVELTTESVTTLPSVDDSPAVVTSEPESQPASAELATEYANEAEALPPSTETELQSTSAIEPPSEIKDPVVTAAPIPTLESTDPGPDAAPTWEPLLVHEEEETLSHRKAPVSVFDFSLPDEPAPAAPSEYGRAPATAIQIPIQRDRAAAFSGSALGLSDTKAGKKEADVSNVKRCPRCGAVYQNSPLSFCTRDNATLIPINELHQLAAPSQNSATPIAVWLLIAFVLGASGFAAYRLTERFYRQPEPAPAEVKPIEAPPAPKKPAFSVGGDLAGSELNIPEPEYPSELVTAGITGPITVRIRVNKNGRVISAATSAGDSRLRSAAVKAARLATFAPDKLAEMNPRRRTVAGSITYDFAAPQSNAATTSSTTSPTATTSPDASAVPSASANPNPDPGAPVVSNELMGAATNVPAADYPARAKRAGIGGAIIVTIRVNRAGRVISWRSSAGDSQLRAAAIRAARKATFARDKLPGNGDVVGTITYNFTP